MSLIEILFKVKIFHEIMRNKIQLYPWDFFISLVRLVEPKEKL